MNGLLIKEIRQKSGMSQAEMADRLKVNQTAVSQWERGIAYPSCDKLPDIADLFHCTIDDLFGRESAAS